MARPSRILTLGLTTCMTVATFASAQGNDVLSAAVAARHAHMDLYQANLMVLGAMAQERIDYNAEAASAAAGNLAALTGLDQRFYWPPGSEAGAVEGSRALPAIWENQADAIAASVKLHDAAMTLSAEAGNGLDALKAAFGPVGAACGSCHEAFRQPR